MKFHQIKALVAVHQTGSLSEASQALHVTQPALSRSIKELEGELGLSLMQRSHKGMTLTDEGRRLIRHAQSSMESLRRLQLEAENIKDMQVGEVTVGVTSLTAVLKGMGESITAFQIRNPRVRIRLIELRPYQIIQQIRDGTLDFAITSQQHTQRLNLDWESLSRMPGLVVCRKNPSTQGCTLASPPASGQLGQPRCDPRSLFAVLPDVRRQPHSTACAHNRVLVGAAGASSTPSLRRVHDIERSGSGQHAHSGVEQ